MSRTVFFGLSGGMGPVFRSLPIAAEFRKEGIEPVFQIYSEASAALINELGFLQVEDDDPTMPMADKLIPASPHFYHLDHYFAQAGLLDDRFLRSWILHRIRMLESVKPDMVVADMSPHSVIAARVLGIPVVTVTQSCFHPNGKRVYAWGDPPRNLPMVTPLVNKILTQYGLPKIARMEDLNAGDLSIVPSIPEMDPIDDPLVKYVGPLEFSLQTNLEEEKMHLQGEPYYLVYPGRLYDSCGDSGLSLVKSVIRAFAGKPEKIIFCLSEGIPADLELPVGNFRVISSFSTELLRHARLFIHHGGHGSCLSAMVNGVPALIIPTHAERQFNARHVYQTGCGEYLLPGMFTAEHLYQLATYVAQDPVYKQNCCEMRRKVEERRYGGAAEAVLHSKKLLMDTILRRSR